jgi:nondiscriminating glutamyl-tRNA synthetase
LNTTDVRVRFAPSPTGFLHVGGARTALFNWLFARHHGGRFILRIEDTDSARFKTEFVNGIYDALRWLKIDWDEGPDVGGPHRPYVQSERATLHRQAAEKLREEGRVYECHCAKPSAESEESEDDPSDGPAPAACRCADLPAAERERLRAQSGGAALRFRVDPARSVTVHDLIRGEVTFPEGTIGDFVIVKSDGNPLYNFAATVDDYTMAITHVIRGEEHLANTPKQLLLYEALGWKAPAMAHLPIILNEQRRKLSKRDGATFVNDYQEMGYLPEAIVNFLALLGWSPGDNRELMTIDEMIRDFRLEGVVKHPAIFDVAKLGWMNKEYLKATPLSVAVERVLELLPKRMPHANRTQPEHVERATALLIDRVRTLADVIDQGSYFFTDGPVTATPEALEKHCTAPETVDRLRELAAALAAAPGFSAHDIEAVIRGLAERSGVKAAAYIHPLRVALTGQAVSPGIFEVASIIGKDVALKRIDALSASLIGTAQLSSRTSTK